MGRSGGADNRESARSAFKAMERGPGESGLKQGFGCAAGPATRPAEEQAIPGRPAIVSSSWPGSSRSRIGWAASSNSAVSRHCRAARRRSRASWAKSSFPKQPMMPPRSWGNAASSSLLGGGSWASSTTKSGPSSAWTVANQARCVSRHRATDASSGGAPVRAARPIHRVIEAGSCGRVRRPQTDSGTAIEETPQTHRADPCTGPFRSQQERRTEFRRASESWLENSFTADRR
jgi:hypothetical protein